MPLLKTLNHLYSNFFMEFLKDPLLVLYLHHSSQYCNVKIFSKTTACTIATSLIHSTIDYCNSLLLNLPVIESSSTCP